MKVAVLLCGNIRSWNVESFIKTFEPSTNTEVDFFIHTYNNILMYHEYIEKVVGVQDNNKKLSTEQVINIIGLEPKAIVVEDQDDIEPVSPDFPINPDTYYQYRKFKLCNDLRLKYEKENNINYDIVIKTRFDIDYSINLQTMLERNEDNGSVYISGGPSIFPCDQIFIAKGDLITDLTNDLLNMGDNENPPSVLLKNKEKYSPHLWLLHRSRGRLNMIGLNTHIIRTFKYELYKDKNNK